MKNMKKLVALFAATVMTMSMSLSAFAATVETTVGADDANISDEAFNLVFTAPTGGETDIDQLTMIAYLVPDTTTLETWVPYSSQPIVAINQVDGDAGFGTVPVDVAKLTDGNAIAVAIGGTNVAAANIYKGLITYEKESNTITVEVVLGDINSDKSVNVTDFNQIKAYYNLTDIQKANYKGKVGTTIGEVYLGDINSDKGVNVTDFNQVKAYYNLTEAQKANYKGKVGTIVTTEVDAQ